MRGIWKRPLIPSPGSKILPGASTPADSAPCCTGGLWPSCTPSAMPAIPGPELRQHTDLIYTLAVMLQFMSRDM